MFLIGTEIIFVLCERFFFKPLEIPDNIAYNTNGIYTNTLTRAVFYA